MKNNIYKILLAGMVLIFSTTSCDEFLDVNTDPNNPTEVTPDLLLPSGQVFTSINLHSYGGISHLGSMMSYQWSESFGFSWYDTEFEYTVTSTFYSNIWRNAYRDALNQYMLLTQIEENGEYYSAIGTIMRAYHFQILVDLYGDIPYTEASLRSENATPVYDDAQTIYQSLIVDLTEAIDLINAAPENPTVLEPGIDDAMFGGDMLAWKQFANTIKVRILTRMSDMSDMQGYIATEFDAISSDGFITGDVVVDPGYSVESGKQNVYWDEFGFSAAGDESANYRATCATDYVIGALEAELDPRLSYLYEEPETGHLGVPQGIESTDIYDPEFVSNIGPGILKSATMGDIILSLAEHNFNMAELAYKGFGGDPETYFNAGIIASFLSLSDGELTVDDAESYYSQNRTNVNYGASADKLEAIITQKWIAVNGISAEQAWFDYSRTGFPADLPVSQAASTPDRPVRLFYPATELSTNAANVPTQIAAFGDANKIFWAQ